MFVACVCVCVLIADPQPRHVPPRRLYEQCKLDPLMNVFSRRIQAQSNYAVYGHLASPFTAAVCQAFTLNENIHRHNHAWHPLLTSCRNTARHDCYAAGNLGNLRLPQRASSSAPRFHCRHAAAGEPGFFSPNSQLS